MGKKKYTGGETWIQPISSVEKIMDKMTNTVAPPPSTSAPVGMQHIGSPPMGGNIDILSGIIQSLNTNPYLIGILMLLLNLGGRFLSFELTKKQELFLQQAWLRPLIFFTLTFIATRNLAVAFWITLFFFFIIWIVANENSPFCLIPGWRNKDAKESAEQVYTNNVQVIKKLQIPQDHLPEIHLESHETSVFESTETDAVGPEPIETLGAPNDSNTT